MYEKPILLLSLETSTPTCSVALHQDSTLLSVSDLHINQSHSVMLTTLIDQIVANSSYTLDQLDAIAVAKGPGSYTGLRIGTSTAKGLCYALDKPLIAINTLEAMAYGLAKAFPTDYLYCPMIDARRMEVYCALYNHQLKPLEETQAKIIDETSFKEYLLNQKIVFFGNGAAKCKALLSQYANAYFVENYHPSAQSVGYLAGDAYPSQKFEDLAYYEPFYLKDFVNNTKLKQK